MAKRDQDSMPDEDVMNIKVALGQGAYDDTKRLPDALVDMYWAMRRIVTKMGVGVTSPLELDKIFMLVFTYKTDRTIAEVEAEYTKEEEEEEMIAAIKKLGPDDMVEVMYRDKLHAAKIIRHTGKSVVVLIEGHVDERTIALNKVSLYEEIPY